MSSVACIVLAAGYSSRFGSDKMLHELPTGKSVVETVVDQYLTVFEHITVVVKSVNSHPLRTYSGVRLVAVEDQQLGLSHSLKMGIAANQASDGWLIALGDMPYIQSTTILKLREALHQDIIVVPMLQSGQGNPVGFGAAFQDQLMCLQGDTGAKLLIERNPASVLKIETQDRGVARDIDRLSDII